MRRQLEFVFRDLPRCAYLGAYYVANGPFALSSARAITELVFRVARGRVQAEFDAFVQTEQGRRLFEERSDLATHLDDRETLSAMPEGSLGRRYLDFMDGMLGADEEVMEGAGGFVSLLQVEEVGKELGWPEEHIWFMRRLTLTHDLTHLLTGYGADNAGEFANLAYTTGHFRIWPLVPVTMGIALTAKPSCGRRRWASYMVQAYRRGRAQEQSLVHLDYESLLPLQLDQVQALIGVATLESAHPEGVVIDELGFANLNKQALLSS